MEDLTNYGAFNQFRDDRPYTFDRFVRLLLSIAIFAAIITVLRSLSGVLIPFFIALLLAYLSEPLVAFAQEKLRVRHRGIAVFITMAFFILVFSALMWWLVPTFIAELKKLTELLRDFFQTSHFRDLIPEKYNFGVPISLQMSTYRSLSVLRLSARQPQFSMQRLNRYLPAVCR